jgi:hypothetical protein
LNEHIRCAECVFVGVDENYSEKNWTAYECKNHESEYHRALLNISVKGHRQSRVTWPGCVEGRQADDN